MGPRFFKRGDTHSGRAVRQSQPASMGPRFFKRGDCRRLIVCVAPRSVLQWGHASLSVETLEPVGDKLHELLLQWGHASLSVETVSE